MGCGAETPLWHIKILAGGLGITNLCYGLPLSTSKANYVICTVYSDCNSRYWNQSDLPIIKFSNKELLSVKISKYQ